MSHFSGRLTPAMQSVVDILTQDGDMEAREIAEMTGLSIKTLVTSGYLARMVTMGVIRVSGYERSGGEPTAVYSVTKGRNADAPATMTLAERSRRWRERVGFGTNEYRRAMALRELARITA
jgi:hypothetical protein